MGFQRFPLKSCSSRIGVLTYVWGEPLKELLQRAAVTDSDAGTVDEALHLPEAYTEGPYSVLEKNVDSIAEEFRSMVLYLLNENNR